MSIQVLSADIYTHQMQTRMPFRYGIAEMNVVSHLFLRLNCDVGGKTVTGVSADGLVPKWFTKDPNSTYQDDLAEMLDVIQSAASFGKATGPTETVFDLWQAVYESQANWASQKGYPPLLWNFGVSLVERALIEAWCRAKETTFALALRSNGLGLRLGEIHARLDGFEAGNLLPEHPHSALKVRHTIGLSDPLTDANIPPGERLMDGLPQSFEANVRKYGLSYYKIKICGEIEVDIPRLRQVASVLRSKGVQDFAFTLDGNEQFGNFEPFIRFWNRLEDTPELTDFMRHMLFVEQPIHRDHALSEETGRELRQWKDCPPIIIDESDAELDSLPRALACGYAGTSHKNCKGVFKGIANACLLGNLRMSDPERPYLLSGEDLTNVGPVALLQDLVVMANLGISHVERNGHHYFRGLSMFPQSLQKSVIEQHSDLYGMQQDFASLKIINGVISINSLLQAPFGNAAELDYSTFTPLKDMVSDLFETNL